MTMASPRALVARTDTSQSNSHQGGSGYYRDCVWQNSVIRSPGNGTGTGESIRDCGGSDKQSTKIFCSLFHCVKFCHYVCQISFICSSRHTLHPLPACLLPQEVIQIDYVKRILCSLSSSWIWSMRSPGRWQEEGRKMNLGYLFVWFLPVRFPQACLCQQKFPAPLRKPSLHNFRLSSFGNLSLHACLWA